jgi:hypothetical protein
MRSIRIVEVIIFVLARGTAVGERDIRFRVSQTEAQNKPPALDDPFT